MIPASVLNRTKAGGIFIISLWKSSPTIPTCISLKNWNSSFSKCGLFSHIDSKVCRVPMVWRLLLFLFRIWMTNTDTCRIYYAQYSPNKPAILLMLYFKYRHKHTNNSKYNACPYSLLGEFISLILEITMMSSSHAPHYCLSEKKW